MMIKIVLLNALLGCFLPDICSSQSNYNYFISNFGRDTNPGTSKLLPRQTIEGTTALLTNYAAGNGHVSVGLKSSSIFNEALVPTYPIQVGVYSDTATYPDFAILNGSEKFDSGWMRVIGGNNTFQQNIECKGFPISGLGIGNYSYIVVIEIDKLLEQSNPFSARRVLQFVPSVESADSVPGSFYEPITTVGNGSNIVKVFVHTSNGSSPNKNPKYRYEVTVRNRAIDGYRNDGNKFENLWVRGYGAGYGLMPSGSNSYYNKVIFGPGSGIHHVVAKSGTFNNCLFLRNSNLAVYALVFYDVQGMNRSNKISNSIFLDLPTAIYSHNSNGSNYNKLELESIDAFADSNGAYTFATASNTDTITLNNISTYGYYSSYNSGSAKFLNIKNSYFHYGGDCVSFRIDPVKAIISNVYINGKDRSRCIMMGINTNLTLTNVILHVKTTIPGGTFVNHSGEQTNHIDAEKNIFICQAKTYVQSGTANTNNGIGTSQDKWDSNVYVVVSGNIVWGVSNKNTNGGDPNVFTFSNWQRQSGQDKHSLFFDLRNDPRGLQAIFIDPDNGNYELANTVEGNQVKALGAGMTTPLPCFLKKPTYEEAAEMIRTEKVPTVNSCRNPCQQAKAKVSFSVTPDAAGIINICQDNEVTLTASGSYLQNDTYYHQSDVKQRYLWWSSDGEDTMGTNLHALTRIFSKPGLTDVRLQMVDENGCSYDTIFTVKVNPLPEKPDLGKDTSLCTGQTLQLGVINKQVTNVYSWSTGISGKGEINITEAGTYAVQSENSSGCQISDTIEVLNKTPITISLGTDTMYCSSSPNLLTTVTTGLVKGYQWNTGAVTDTFRISSAGTYIVTAKDFGVCIASDTVTLIENPVNLFSLPGDTTICEGTTYQLSLAPPPATSITWNDGTTAYTHQIQGGIYVVTANNAGCVKKDEMSVSIQPLPVVHLGKDVTLCSGYSLPLSVRYPGASFMWNTGSMDSNIIARDGGTYWVQTTLNGCSYRDSMELKLESCNCTIRMPNAFSPNGDGINDVVRASVECFPEAFNLSIFDRYGHLVYSSKDYRGFWDGNFNGKPQPVGTYYYILSFRNESLQQSKPFSGSLTLLR